jgi:hypothetical protein
MLTIISSNARLAAETAQKEDLPAQEIQDVLDIPVAKPEEEVQVPQVAKTEVPGERPPEVVPQARGADLDDPLNRLVFKYKKFKETDPERSERILVKIMENQFYGKSLSDFTEDMYQRITGGEVGKTAWEVLMETGILDKWDGSKGNFFGYYANTVGHDAVKEKSKLDAKRAGIEKEWNKQWQDAAYLRDYVAGFENRDKNVIPPHIMNFENYMESGKTPPGWDDQEWKKYSDSLIERFTYGDRGPERAFRFDDNEKILEASFWDRHDFRRPNRVEDAISDWNQSMGKLEKLLNENNNAREELGHKFPQTIATKESIAEINEKARTEAKEKGVQWHEQFESPETTVWLVEELQPRATRSFGKVTERNFGKIKKVFEYLAENHPELAKEAGITKETMFEKPSMGRPGIKEEKPYKGQDFLNYDMIDPFQRHYATKRMLDIQKAYMNDVRKAIPLSMFSSPETGLSAQFADPKALSPLDILIEEEEGGQPRIALRLDRTKRFGRANELLRKATLSC